MILILLYSVFALILHTIRADLFIVQPGNFLVKVVSALIELINENILHSSTGFKISFHSFLFNFCIASFIEIFL